MTRRFSMDRRQFLVAVGTGAATALAGCTGDGIGIDSEHQYEDGTVGDVDGENRSVDETTAAEALAAQETHEGVTSLDVLELVDHEFVLEDDYRRSTVQGTVENAGGDRVEIAEVRVRVFNDDGEQIGSYLDSTNDLDGDTNWAFEVVLLESPADVATYDITVLGTPT